MKIIAKCNTTIVETSIICHEVMHVNIIRLFVCLTDFFFCLFVLALYLKSVDLMADMTITAKRYETRNGNPAQ